MIRNHGSRTTLDRAPFDAIRPTKEELAMSVLEIERKDGVMVLRINRPDRMGALNTELRLALADAWCEFRDSKELEVAIYTGTGRAFCAGEDMKESLERGTAGSAEAARSKENPYDLR